MDLPNLVSFMLDLALDALAAKAIAAFDYLQQIHALSSLLVEHAGLRSYPLRGFYHPAH